MTHIGLFEGIGGFSLAAGWMGWKTLATCEIAEFPQKVLKYYWPEAYHHGDIHTLDYETINTELSKRFGSHWRNDDIILTGGFPCQPFSLAGKRKGTEDNRNLWPEMFRIIREIQPAYVVGENVPGIINWSAGLVFEQVQADLENEGYEVQPVILPACSQNAPHKRERVWFVAHAKGHHNSRNTATVCCKNEQKKEKRQEKRIPKPASSGERIVTNTSLHGHELRGLGENRPMEIESEEEKNKRQRIWNDIRGNGQSGITTNTGVQVLERQDGEQMDETIQPSKYTTTNATGELQQGNEPGKGGNKRRENIQHQYGKTNTKQPGTMGENGNVTYSNDQRLQRETTNGNMEGQFGFSKRGIKEHNAWSNFPTQPPVCGGDDGLPSQLDGITFPKWRNESIKAYGNAIVPQVAHQIFKAINLSITQPVK